MCLLIFKVLNTETPYSKAQKIAAVSWDCNFRIDPAWWKAPAALVHGQTSDD